VIASNQLPQAVLASPDSGVVIRWRLPRAVQESWDWAKATQTLRKLLVLAIPDCLMVFPDALLRAVRETLD
jgi:hypothetical protein